MNPRKLMAVALCAAACVTTTAFAGDDDLVVSASPATTVAEPVNPKQGMVFNGYNLPNQFNDKFQKLQSILASQSAVKTTVVKTETFSFDQFLTDTKINQGVWEGFLKCKKSATCTFILKQGFGIGAGFHLYVDGKKIAAAWDQVSGEAAVRAGFNHIKIITQTTQPVQLFMKVSGSVKEPNVLSPGRMFYDDNPNEDDDIL